MAIGAAVLVLSGGALGGVLSGTLTSADPTNASRAEAAPTAEDDPKDKKDKKDKREKAEKKHDKADKHRQQRAFVTAKKAWSACVAEAEPRRGRDQFDPEQACGTKPHPHHPSGKPGHARSS